jgi:drug/metabolite transporter (DMT)-like permease
MFKYHLVAFLVVAIWGVTFVSTKLLLLNGLSPAHIFTLRFVIAYVMLLGASCFLPRHRWMSKNLKDELIMFGLGVTGGSLYFLTENAAMNYTTTTNTSLIVCLCPLFASLLISICYKSERLHGLQIVGSLLAAIGVTIVVLNGRFVLHLSPIGDALAFAACLCWALYSLLLIPASKRYDTLFITRKVFAYGLLSMLPYYAVYPDLPPMEALLRYDTILQLLFLGCIASTICFLVWNWVIRRLGAIVTTNYVYFNPVVTILCAWVVLNERITGWFILGTVLILTGMYLADRKQKASHKA